MITGLVLAQMSFVILRTLDGRDVHVNPRQVVSVAKPSPTGKAFDTKVHCVVYMTDGKFISIAEECDSIRRRLEEARK